MLFKFKMSLAIAEEFACQKKRNDVLHDNDNELLSEDEAIFALEIISDIDARGCYQLIF